jgi:peptidoglycan hydrolase-like protein with peptidoglycan-binding domain
MRQAGKHLQHSRGRTFIKWVALAVGVTVVLAACGDDSGSSSGTTAAADPVAAAQARVTSAQTSLDTANGALTSAQKQFCNDASAYVAVLDRYGKLFTDSKTTVGDVKTGGADLIAPKEAVTASATAIDAAQADVAKAAQDLADAQTALSAAQSGSPASTAAPVTTTTLVPPATIARVKQAEADFQTAAAGINDSTPLLQAAAAYNSAAFGLEVAWSKLLADAGCLTDVQQAEAVRQLTAYTVELQTDLATAGYYNGAIDGIYGPLTLAGVEQLQKDSGLPVTGLVDQATGLALEKKLAKTSLQTAALQSLLKLTGYYTGPVDGKWTPALTDALKQFQTASGLEPTGAVDAATLAAFQEAIAQLPPSTTTTTTVGAATSAAPATTAASTSTAASPGTTVAPTTASAVTTT